MLQEMRLCLAEGIRVAAHRHGAQRVAPLQRLGRGDADGGERRGNLRGGRGGGGGRSGAWGGAKAPAPRHPAEAPQRAEARPRSTHRESSGGHEGAHFGREGVCAKTVVRRSERRARLAFFFRVVHAGAGPRTPTWTASCPTCSESLQRRPLRRRCSSGASRRWRLRRVRATGRMVTGGCRRDAVRAVRVRASVLRVFCTGAVMIWTRQLSAGGQSALLLAESD